MKKSIKDYENEYKVAAEKIEAELTFIRKAIDEETSKEKNAQEKAEKAFESCDINAYRAAQTEICEAQDTRAMHTQLLQRKQNEHHMSRSEFNSVYRGIHKCIDEAISAEADKLIALADDVEASAQRIYEIVNKGNELTEKYQRNIYNDERLRNGTSSEYYCLIQYNKRDVANIARQSANALRKLKEGK